MKINDECIKDKELIDVILKKIENIALKRTIESYEEFKNYKFFKRRKNTFKGNISRRKFLFRSN